jgi:3-oxoadipate enol-lactonase
MGNNMKTVKLFYEEMGASTPVVCLHGYPLDHTIWLDMAQELASEARMILPDLRGHGQSPVPEGPYCMAELAADVVRLLDDLGIERAAVFGHSMGGYVGLAFARHFPERLLGLGLVASRAFADTPEKQELRAQIIPLVLENGVGLLTSMAEKLTADAALQDEMREMILRAHPQGVAGVLYAMGERPDDMAMLAEQAVPIAVIAGAEDRIVDLERSLEMRDALPPGHYIELAAGHMPMMEAPALTADALRAALEVFGV